MMIFQKLAASITVDIGEDRILLQTRSNIYHLDIYLPYNVVQDESAAQYNKNTKVQWKRQLSSDI